MRPVSIGWRKGALMGACLGLLSCAASPPPTGVDVPPDTLAVEEGGAPALAENVATALLIASALAESGDTVGALRYYQYAYDQDPSNVEVGRRYVSAAVRAGHPRQAIAALAKLQAAHPEDADLGFQRGHLLLLMGEHEKAERVTAELLERHPEHEPTQALRVDALQSLGREKEALEILDRMIEASPADVELRVRRAGLLLRLDRKTEAEENLRKAFEMDPESDAAFDALRGLLAGQGRAHELIPLLEEPLEAGETLPASRLMTLADLYLDADRAPDAAELLLPLARQGELDAPARMLLADLLSTLGREEEAWQVVQRLLEEGEGSPLLLRMAGELALEREENHLAESYLRQAVASDPHDVDAVLSLLLALGREHEGLFDAQSKARPPEEVARERDELLERALKGRSPNSLRQNFLLGALLRRLERFEQALSPLERARKLDPENATLLYDLAVTQEATGYYEKAAETLEDLLAQDPEDAHILNFYGYLLADQGWQLQRAERMIVRALEQEPDNPYYLDSLGWVYFRLGRYEDALDKLIHASNGLGDDPTVLEHLGDTLRELGRIEQAQAMYERALEAGGDPERLRPRIEELKDRATDAP